MSSSFSIALSSLEANSEAINTAGNNLANLNTDGFKESQVDFKNLFSTYVSNASGVQVGLGVTLQNNQVFSQGAIQSSTSGLASAIQGNGFFIVSSPDNPTLLTRDGNFTTDAKGVLQTQTGETLQGWTATQSGINTTGPIGSIALPAGTILPPVATQNFTVSANLNSQGVAGATSGTFSTPLAVIDSLGNSHDLTITFTRSSSAAGTWNYDITIPGGDLAGGTAGQQQSILTAPGTITFTSDGTMSTSGGTGPITMSINGLADGASNMSLNWNIFDQSGAGTITQYSETSNTSSSTQDGSAAAQLTSIGIQNGGQVVATFSNGQSKVEAQLAMASVENPNSLQNVGNNNYATTAATATPAIGVPQSGGRGQILGGSLEGSNVDMAKEFTNLIIFQSGYQASSRVISTVQQLSTDLFNLIH